MADEADAYLLQDTAPFPSPDSDTHSPPVDPTHLVLLLDKNTPWIIQSLSFVKSIPSIAKARFSAQHVCREVMGIVHCVVGKLFLIDVFDKFAFNRGNFSNFYKINDNITSSN